MPWQPTSERVFFLVGPCVLQNLESALQIAKTLLKIKEQFSIDLVFKASFDKANRSSLNAFRGTGLSQGLEIFKGVKAETGLPILTDIHEPDQAAIAAEVVDILQIPAFLCRQTDLLVAAGQTRASINIKKGQFMAPWDMKYVVEKVKAQGNSHVMITERGASFGYNTLVSDFRAIPIMQQFCPVVFDVTHSLQQPGGLGGATSGEAQFIPYMARAAVAVGADGLFLEVFPNPSESPSDGKNMLALRQFPYLVEEVLAIRSVLSKKPSYDPCQI
ncbi:MAG: 3-deoxy-8-phosphooctulonate synthase [Planctomycetota bacterium]